MIERIMGNPWIYSAWQFPFADKKMRPVVAHNDLRGVTQVLELGCGPGTNAAYFQQSSYEGVDHNPKYTQHACKRYPHAHFITADATIYQSPRPSEFVLLNSLLHHLHDDHVHRVLSTVHDSLLEQGTVHIIELVLAEKGLPAWLARHDRGKYVRTGEKWQHLFRKHFQALVFEPFTVDAFGVPLWELLYFKGRRRDASG